MSLGDRLSGRGLNKSFGYLLLEPDGAGAWAAGSLISWPALSSTLGAMPLRRETSSAETLLAAAILAIVSPLRARTLLRPGAVDASVALRRQLVSRTFVLGTTNFVVDFGSMPGFIDCRVATLTPVRLATDCRSSPGAMETILALSRESGATRLSKAASCFPLPAGTRTL